MIRDYMLVSPSLEGVLRHETLLYEGIARPADVLRVLDGPAARGGGGPAKTPEERRILERYFHDLYGIFMKKLSYFVVESDPGPAEQVKLQAMLQELIKIKGLIGEAQESPENSIDL